MVLAMLVCPAQPASREVHRSAYTCLLEEMLKAATDPIQINLRHMGDMSMRSYLWFSGAGCHFSAVSGLAYFFFSKKKKTFQSSQLASFFLYSWQL